MINDFPQFEMDEVSLLISAVQKALERLKIANEARGGNDLSVPVKEGSIFTGQERSQRSHSDSHRRGRGRDSISASTDFSLQSGHDVAHNAGSAIAHVPVGESRQDRPRRIV